MDSTRKNALIWCAEPTLFPKVPDPPTPPEPEPERPRPKKRPARKKRPKDQSKREDVDSPPGE